MQNTQPKFKWHNEVIAWLNGETIEFKQVGSEQWHWTSIVKNDNIPAFFEDWEYRIKPKEVIKYAGIFTRGSLLCMSETEFDTLNEALTYMSSIQSSHTKFQKRTYLNGELIALELVKV